MTVSQKSNSTSVKKKKGSTMFWWENTLQVEEKKLKGKQSTQQLEKDPYSALRN